MSSDSSVELFPKFVDVEEYFLSSGPVVMTSQQRNPYAVMWLIMVSTGGGISHWPS